METEKSRLAEVSLAVSYRWARFGVNKKLAGVSFEKKLGRVPKDLAQRICQELGVKKVIFLRPAEFRRNFSNFEIGTVSVPINLIYTNLD